MAESPSRHILLQLGTGQPKQGLILDLHRGFSSTFGLNITNNGSRTLAHNIPLFVLQPDDNDTKDDAVDLARAFSEGVLEITDEDQKKVRINYPTNSYCSDLQTSYVPPRSRNMRFLESIPNC